MSQTVLITGAASGIGYQLAALLAQNAFEVHVFDLKAPEQALPGVHYWQVDVADFNDVDMALRRLGKKFDVLINNAGVMRRGDFQECSELDFDLVMKVNLKAVWLMTKLAMPYLKENATLLQMSSKNAVYLKESTFVYSLSKVAVAVLSEMIQKTFKKLRVKIAFPGPVDTPLEREGKTAQELDDLRNSVMVTPEFMAERLFELLQADETYLIYNQDHNKYYLSYEKPVTF